MIYKETQQKSLLDFLVQIMPDWQNQVMEFKQSPRYLVNGKAAKTLFTLWKDEQNKVDNKILKRPTNVSIADVKEMQHAGLIRDLGDKIEVTKKGSDIIQTMILGDDKSIWEDDGKTLTFETSYANTKRRGKTARKSASEDTVEKIDVDKNVDNQDEEKGVNAPVGDEEEPNPQGNWWQRLKSK